MGRFAFVTSLSTTAGWDGSRDRLLALQLIGWTRPNTVLLDIIPPTIVAVATRLGRVYGTNQGDRKSVV